MQSLPLLVPNQADICRVHAGGARLPKFHTSVGGGGDLQDPNWYPKHGEQLVVSLNFILAQGVGHSEVLEQESNADLSYIMWSEWAKEPLLAFCLR